MDALVEEVRAARGERPSPGIGQAGEWPHEAGRAGLVGTERPGVRGRSRERDRERERERQLDGDGVREVVR